MFIDSYASSIGMRVATGLVNALVVAPPTSPISPGEVVAGLLAFDPTSVADRPADHGDGFLDLAQELHHVFQSLDQGRVDDAADTLNRLLEAAPAVPHLVHDNGRWSLHHHPHGAGLVQAWTSICAESLARIVGDGYPDRVHLCASTSCRQAFVDSTKNATRRYCCERCQNREKATALRRRRALYRSS